jgi:hypothetical protein
MNTDHHAIFILHDCKCIVLQGLHRPVIRGDHASRFCHISQKPTAPKEELDVQAGKPSRGTVLASNEDLFGKCMIVFTHCFDV